MLGKRTWIQRLRTLSEIPVEVDLADPPLYQRIADEAKALHESGMNLEAIGRKLSVSGQTVAKGIDWMAKAPIQPS